VVFPWSPRAPLRHQVLAGTTRVMLRLVAGAADRVFVSIPPWAEHLPARVRRLAEWRPVPSTLPSEVPASAVEAVRSALGPGPWLGHFGTYGALTAVPLEAVLVPLLRAGPERKALLLGRGSRAFAEALGARHPEVAGRLVTRDSLAAEEVAAHLAACDVLVQPYPDGVSARRTTAMAGLALGRPLVTNSGHLTEPMWRELGVVALVEGTSAEPLVAATERVLADAGARTALGERAARVYRERFSLERTVEALLHPGPVMGGSS
jgi:glycosyltransferase involved in cell wall biosynthesis